ncbi:MAG: DUF1572 family protein [Gemmatimonadales bacterium]
MESVATAFLTESGRYLTEEYLPKIRAALVPLSDDDVWWRPNEASNSIGNLLLHLAGNVRQWIVAGVGGATDQRDRSAEFTARGSVTKDQALATLESAVANAAAVLSALPPSRLPAQVRIQGRDTTVFDAIYHVIEHFSTHTGQILWIAKARSGRDLGFYQDAGGLAKPQWPGARPID